jgi:3-hydroxybutyryl-CoA dehydrogenase
MEIKNVLIYGAGMMGKGIAQVFSSCEDLSITLFDLFEMDVHTPIRQNFEQLRRHGVITEEEIESRLSRIRFTTDKKDLGLRDAQIVIECVFEDMKLKQDTLELLESICRTDTIFCTNTSVMSPTEISAKLVHKERFVGTHFWNPAHLIPLVEVVRTDKTSDAVVETVIDILTKVGKRPVLCKKDVPGFIANRMQHALWREAISIVENGIADAKTVDEAVRYSFGLRLPQLAPLENADMVGLDLTFNIHQYILPHLEDSHKPSRLLSEHIQKGELGFKSGRGMQSWTAEEAQASGAALNEYLIKMIYGK